MTRCKNKVVSLALEALRHSPRNLTACTPHPKACIAQHGRLKTVSAAWAFAGLALVALAGCSAGDEKTAPRTTMNISLLGFNDFHGNLEPPKLTVAAQGAPGQNVDVPAGGAAYLATAIDRLRAANPYTAVVVAGDTIGASPMLSSLFLDEPTIGALNLMRVDFAATGNHEYDQGAQELLRIQNGGCEQYTARMPCRLETFGGAQFQYLAANTVRDSGGTLFPATGIKFFEQDGRRIGVGFIGMTLKATPNMVRPSGVQGLSFTAEAATANALVPRLRAQGADIIVLLIHEGGQTTSDLQDDSCAGLSGDIVPILDALSTEIDVVISGHTHSAYICDYARVNANKPFLLTSAGYYGTLLTEITLTVDTGSRRLTRKTARQHIVQGEGFTNGARTVPVQPQFPIYQADPAVTNLVARYSAAVAPLANESVGLLAAPATRTLGANGESVLGRIVADSILTASRAPAAGGAQIAFMNSGGIRADLFPDAASRISYGLVFAVQPFGNTLMVQTMTGEQIRQVLEQQFDSGSNTPQNPRILQVSEGFSYAFDVQQPTGQRISDMRLDGVPLALEQNYRVGLQNYLGAGGDNFSVFTQGTDIVGGGLDVDALADHIRASSAGGVMALPLQERIINLGGF